MDNRPNKAANSEYEDDFEDGDDAEDEEDDDCRDMLITRQWLDDQGRFIHSAIVIMQNPLGVVGSVFQCGTMTFTKNVQENYVFVLHKELQILILPIPQLATKWLMSEENISFRLSVASRGRERCRMGGTARVTRTHPTTSTRRNRARTLPTATREARTVGLRPESPRPTHGKSSSRKEQCSR